jgi:hypothetical protein
VKFSCQVTYQHQQILAALVLTGVLSLSADMTCVDAAAGSIEYSEGVAKDKRLSLEVSSLPLAIAQRAESKAKAGIGEHLSNLVENFMVQLSEEIPKSPSQDNNLPESVAQAVLQDASKRSNLPRRELRVAKAEPRNWPDGCLGLPAPDSFCTQIVVSGWQVIVEGKQRSFVYHTNNSGSLVKLAEE